MKPEMYQHVAGEEQDKDKSDKLWWTTSGAGSGPSPEHSQNKQHTKVTQNIRIKTK